MKVIDKISGENENNFNDLVKAGIISTKYYYYKEIYLLVQHYINTGSQKMAAYNEFAEKYNVHMNTIINACREMKREAK